MFRYFKSPVMFLSFAALLLYCSRPAIPQASEHRTHSVVQWYADLRGAHDSSGVQTEAVHTQAMGKADASFDFPNKTATFTIKVSNISDVKKVEVREARSRGDISGPTLLTLYDSKQGPFEAPLVKTVTGPAFDQVSQPVLNGRGVVVVSTKAHPDGELAGVISMHKHYE